MADETPTDTKYASISEFMATLEKGAGETGGVPAFSDGLSGILVSQALSTAYELAAQNIRLSDFGLIAREQDGNSFVGWKAKGRNMETGGLEMYGDFVRVGKTTH